MSKFIIPRRKIKQWILTLLEKTEYDKKYWKSLNKYLYQQILIFWLETYICRITYFNTVFLNTQQYFIIRYLRWHTLLFITSCSLLNDFLMNSKNFIHELSNTHFHDHTYFLSLLLIRSQQMFYNRYFKSLRSFYSWFERKTTSW